MIDKTVRNVTIKQFGDIVVIRYTGGPDCLWMNMYLDLQDWTMTAVGDIGEYSYHWGKAATPDPDFLSFCVKWFMNEEWLLRKCIGEMHREKQFDNEKSAEALLEACDEYYEDQDFEDDREIIKEILDECRSYDSSDLWINMVSFKADEEEIELPYDWCECVVEEYDPWQKRFAEICGMNISPALESFIKEVNNGYKEHS